MRDLTFNGKKLSDFGLCIDSVEVSPPTKKQVTKSVPYMSGNYDFSSLYGGPVFDNRTLKYTVDVIADTETELAEIKTDIWNWLLFGDRGKLYDSVNGDYYYVASCTEITDEDDVEKTTLTILFDADPFKKKDYSVTKTISASGTISINNDGYTDVYADISVSGDPATDLEISISNSTENKTYLVERETGGKVLLRKGVNNIGISGHGDVTITYRREVL